MTQYAKFKTNVAWLGQDFGEGFARRVFGDAAVDSLPRYARGKSAGKIKAEIAWVRCVEGGWVGQGRDAMREEAIGRVGAPGWKDALRATEGERRHLRCKWRQQLRVPAAQLSRLPAAVSSGLPRGRPVFTQPRSIP
jgi:hypothetical protein